MRIGILTEYPSPSVISGPAIHSKFLKEQMEGRGHDVVMMGPNTGTISPVEASEATLFPAFGYPTHPNVKIPLPGRPGRMFENPKVDVIHSQTACHMIQYGVWIRQMWKVPLINTHTVHLPTFAHYILSERLSKNQFLKGYLDQKAFDVECNFAKLYNMGDCLIVQSRHYVDYWRQRGVTVPIKVIGRPIDPEIFSTQPAEDPYPAHFKVGKRLLACCRHDREKRLDHLIDIFVERLAPNDPDVTLTLVGDGHDHINLAERAWLSPYADRIYFPGEVPHASTVDWYAHGDVFVYTSLSETFGNVINEALWCGMPVVALNDKMGVAHQVADEVNGYLIEPNRVDTEAEFATRCADLLDNRSMRRVMGEEAANLARRNSHPEFVLDRFESLYETVREHCDRAVENPLVDASRWKQWRVFTRCIGSWAMWNTLLLSVAHTATRLGMNRPKSGTQHSLITCETFLEDIRKRREEQEEVQRNGLWSEEQVTSQSEWSSAERHS